MESAENRERPTPDNSQELAKSNLSKEETLKLLNDTIDRLERAIEGISQNRAPIPSSDSLATLLTTTRELADKVTPVAPPQPEPTPAPEVKVDSPSPSKDSPVTPANPVEVPVREESPLVKAQKRKSLGLIAICVAALAVAIVAIFQIWLPRQEVISSLPPVTEPTVTEVGEPSAEPTVTPVEDAQGIANNLEPVEELPNDSEPVTQSLPPVLESPGKPTNVKVVAIEPKLNFTPEQTLVAAIVNKVTKAIADYPSELIDSVMVDLPQNNLKVNVSDEWYALDRSRQTKIAEKMLEQSRQLSFSKLELEDRSGTLVARNPVIGKNIIIVQHEREQLRDLEKQLN